MKALYEALLTRDLEQIGGLVRQECGESGVESTRDTILRFTVLAFAPSLHSRAAMYAALAIVDLFDRYDDPTNLLIECARYVSESRVPWSDAPVTDPPSLPESYVARDSGVDQAIAVEDVHEAETWLAALLETEEIALPFFDAAARHAGEEGYGFITAVAAWRIAERFPPVARFGVLRTALIEWIHSREMPDRPAGQNADDAMIAAIRSYVGSRGEPDRFTPLLLGVSTHLAETITGTPGRYSPLVTRYLSEPGAVASSTVGSGWTDEDLAYRYAADYAFFLQSVPLSERLRQLVDDPQECERIPDAAHDFLKRSEGFQEWSFA